LWHSFRFGIPDEQPMKSIITWVAFFLMSAAYAHGQGEEILTGKPRDKDLFVMKTDKKFVGATVEIYSSEGELLTAQHLVQRKMVIDFSPVAQDTYIIRVVKGEEAQEFYFKKK
jgi:hypothetical protein